MFSKGIGPQGVDLDKGKNKTILVVDDSKLARMIVSNIIMVYFNDWEIIEAENVLDATEKSKNKIFDAITLDMNMPGRDGLSYAPELQKMHPKAKIALLTANIQPKVQQRAEEIGLFFIPKPVSYDKLLGFMENIEK